MRSCLPILPLVAGFALTGLSPACAQDQAKIAILGFNRSGSVFGFEQFGWQNGVSFPYSELTILVTETGKNAAGAPYSSIVAKDDATQASARAVTYAAAKQALRDLELSTPGATVAQASGDPNDPAAREISFDVTGLGRVTMKLDTAVVKSVGCDATGVKVRALAVRLNDDKGVALRTLYKEKNPPPERQCPTGYGVAEVRLLARGNDPPVLAAVIGYDRPGINGTDRRYLAVVSDLAKPPAAEAGESKGEH